MIMFPPAVMMSAARSAAHGPRRRQKLGSYSSAVLWEVGARWRFKSGVKRGHEM